MKNLKKDKVKKNKEKMGTKRQFQYIFCSDVITGKFRLVWDIELDFKLAISEGTVLSHINKVVG